MWVVRGLLLGRLLESCDGVLGLPLAIGVARVVIAVTAGLLLLATTVATVAVAVVFAVVARVVVLFTRLASGSGFVFLIGPELNHALQLGDGSPAAAAEVNGHASVKETVLEDVDDLFVADVHNGSAFVEESSQVVAEGFDLPLLDLRQIHAIAVATK